MRAIVPLFLLAAALPADEAKNLAPRAGSGWDGFPKGAWVKMKRTATPQGRVPMVTVWTTKLLEADRKHLTIETVSRNAVGMEQRTKLKVPRRGEAGVDEKQSVEKLPDEKVTAAKKTFVCKKRRTTVTGPHGRRVVTDWRDPSNGLRVKRTQIDYDKDGRVSRRFSMMLVSLETKTSVGNKILDCLEYRTLARQGDRETTGRALTTREIPGNTVRESATVKQKGKEILRYQVEALAYRAR